MIAYNIPKTKWPAELRAILKDNALAAFLAVAPTNSNNYEKIKTATLTRAGISTTSRFPKFWDHDFRSSGIPTPAQMNPLLSCMGDCGISYRPGLKV